MKDNPERHPTSVDVMNGAILTSSAICAENWAKSLATNEKDSYENLITFVKDHPGNDHIYVIDASKIKTALNRVPHHAFEKVLTKTIRWYLDQQDWVNSITSGVYRDYYIHQ